MLFDFDLVIPAGTLQASPYDQLVQLTRGKLREIRVIFPPGPAILVFVVVSHNLHQLMPANNDGSLNLDDVMIVSRLDYDLVDAPYELKLSGWSPDAVYEHTITFQFELEPATGDDWETFNRVLFSLNQTERRR